MRKLQRELGLEKPLFRAVCGRAGDKKDSSGSGLGGLVHSSLEAERPSNAKTASSTSSKPSLLAALVPTTRHAWPCKPDRPSAAATSSQPSALGTSCLLAATTTLQQARAWSERAPTSSALAKSKFLSSEASTTMMTALESLT